MTTGWYYLHTNGELIYKPESVGTAADIRESEFARMLWPVDPSNRAQAWMILIEARALGANLSRIIELAEMWNCTNQDADNFEAWTRMFGTGLTVKRDRDQWCAHRTDFVNLQESPAGFGGSKLDAMAELCKALGYKASKIGWGANFQQLLK